MATNPQAIKPIGCATFFVIGFIIFGIAKCSSCGSNTTADKTPKTYEPPSTEMAYVQSIDFVKQYLKSPSTADFDTFSASPDISSPSENEYIVSYHFDAENSFGAKLRSTYICSLKYLSGDPDDINNWELESMIIDGQMVKGSSKETKNDEPSNEPPTEKFNIKYEIVNKETDNTGAVNMVYVYVKGKNKLDSLNEYLVNEYKDKNVTGFQIYYFNNRKIAKNYFKTLFDKNVSDAEIDRLSTHIVARYEYNSADGGKFIVGKEAQE
jgi:hypothetical protein